MITEQDLQEAIAECLGQKNPNASTCIKLAAFYTIKNELFPNKNQSDPFPVNYSYAGPSDIEYDSGTEFSESIRDKNQNDILGVFDELMSTLQVLQPKLYNGVLRKIDGL